MRVNSNRSNFGSQKFAFGKHKDSIDRINRADGATSPAELTARTRGSNADLPESVQLVPTHEIRRDQLQRYLRHSQQLLDYDLEMFLKEFATREEEQNKRMKEQFSAKKLR